VAGFLIVARNITEPFKRNPDAAASDDRSFPRFSLGSGLGEAVEKKLQSPSGHFRKGKLARRSMGFGALIKIVRELDLRANHDGRIASHIHRCQTCGNRGASE